MLRLLPIVILGSLISTVSPLMAPAQAASFVPALRSEAESLESGLDRTMIALEPIQPQAGDLLDLPEDEDPIDRNPHRTIVEPQEVRPLPGSLDTVPVFNSNNPEIVRTAGILLSTFAGDKMRNPSAHLNYTFQDRFDIFAHHISQAKTAAETRSMFQGVMLYNPGNQVVSIEVLQAASYLTRPDAIFVKLPNYVEDPIGRIFAGPGSRISNDILRGRRQGIWPAVVQIPPKEAYMLMNLPIPAGKVVPTSNGRTTLIRLWSSGPVNVANLSMYAPQEGDGERLPTIDEWLTVLTEGALVQPRDRTATPPGTRTKDIIYSRVSGVSKGSRWKSRVTDSAKVNFLTIPKEGDAISFGLSTLADGTLGTGQVQSAPMLRRYPDSAYLANGNYGTEYNITLPLGNPRRTNQMVTIAIQTPMKDDRLSGGLRFLEPPEPRIFFRGTVRIRYQDNADRLQTRYVHLVQRRGEQGQALVMLNLRPGERRVVQVDFLYPPDATPPQVLTVRTLDQLTASRTAPILVDQ